MDNVYIQDLIPGNHCFGCGPDNQLGLQIKSYQDEDRLICRFTPSPQHTTWVSNYVNGGIIASVIDCHSIWAAIAHAYTQEQREFGDSPNIIYVTANLSIDYRQPTPAQCELELIAKVTHSEGKKSQVECTLQAEAEICAQASVLAVRVEGAW